MRREMSRVSFLMCPFCVRALFPIMATRRSCGRCGGRARSPSARTLTFGYPPSRFGGWVRGPLRRVSASLGWIGSPVRRFADRAGGIGERGRELAGGER